MKKLLNQILATCENENELIAILDKLYQKNINKPLREKNYENIKALAILLNYALYELNGDENGVYYSLFGVVVLSDITTDGLKDILAKTENSIWVFESLNLKSDSKKAAQYEQDIRLKKMLLAELKKRGQNGN